MSSELTVTIQRMYAKGYDGMQMETVQNIVDVAGTLRFQKRLTITSASEVNVDISAVASPGWCRVRNLDTVNFVKIGPATTVYMHAPKAGECEMFRLLNTVSNLFMRADTAPVDVLLEVFPA